MLQPQQEICKYYYLKGKCKFGNKCNKLHINSNNINQQINQNINMINPNQMQDINQNQNQNLNNYNCKYFIQGNCKSKNCNLFHGYGNKLQYLFYKKVIQNQIINIVLISENKFILCDEHIFKIFILENNEINQIGEQTLKEGKIHKLFYSNGKIIIVNIKDTM
jgi:hypothetical protein